MNWLIGYALAWQLYGHVFNHCWTRI